MTFAKRFGLWFGIISALVGLFLAAAEQDLEVAFWIVLAGSFLIAVFPDVRAVLNKALVSYRAHDTLLQQVGQLRDDVDSERQRRLELDETVRDAFTSGVREGMMRVLGSVLSNEALPPILVGLAETDGTLVLIARSESGEEVRQGARYDLRFTDTDDLKGIVEVRQVDPEATRVELVCVDRTSARFWEHLEEKVSVDQRPPPGCALFPSAYDSPLDYDPLMSNAEDSLEAD